MKKNLMRSFLSVALLLIATSVFADISYPESLKKEIRCYPHAQITQTLDVSDTKMATLFVTDRFSKIPDFYSRELNKTGWRINKITEGDNRVTIDAGKAGKTLLINAELHKSGDSTIRITME
jgi:hypothetical protein